MEVPTMSPEQQPTSPRESANWLQILSFSWMWRLLWKGRSRQLEMTDIYRVLPHDKASHMAQRVLKVWNAHMKDCLAAKKEPSFLKVLIRLFGKRFLILTLLCFINETLILVAQPLSLAYLLQYLQSQEEKVDNHEPEWVQYVSSLGIIFTCVWYTMTFHILQFFIHQEWTHIRIACSVLIYQKCMKISQTSLGPGAISEALTLMSTDVNRLDELEIFCIYLLIAPLQLAFMIYLLYTYFGNPALIGLFLFVCYMPLQAVMGKFFSDQRTQHAKKTDIRLRIITEIFTNIKVIKMYGWENYFTNKASRLRKIELHYVKKTSWLRATNSVMSFTITKLIAFLTLLTYVIVGGEDSFLSPKLVFVTLVVYENMRTIVTIYFAKGVEDMAELLLVVSRIEHFLLQKERKFRRKYSIETDANTPMRDIQVHMENCTFYREGQSGIPLHNINLDLKGNGLTMLVGPGGSGKSGLLLAVWGDLEVRCGSLQTQGTITYVSGSDPWIFRGTVQENILFGRPYRPDWYNKVVEACAIQEVIEALPNNDKCKIDSFNISKGYMCRISLARAVYSDAHIFLLDDCMVHIDTHAARRIMENCIFGLLRNKLIMFATTQLQFLEHADRVVLLIRGKIRVDGTYLEFKAQQNKYLDAKVPLQDNLDSEPKGIGPPDSIFINIEELELVEDIDAEDEDSIGNIDMCEPILVVHARQPELHPDEKFLLHVVHSNEEMITKKHLGLRIYFRLIQMGSNRFVVVIISLISILTQVVHSGTEYWLEIFAQSEEYRHEEKMLHNSASHTHHYGNSWYDQLLNLDRSVQTIVFATCIIALFAVSLIRTTIFYGICVRASTTCYDTIMACLLKAPLKFFDLNTTSRILNRLSQDISTIDDHLPPSLYELLDTFSLIVGVLILVSYLKPIFAIPSVALLICAWGLQYFHQKTLRSLKRLEALSRSPIITTLTTTLKGLSTIHSFQQEQMFYNRFYNALDSHTATWYVYQASQRWLGFYIGWCSVFYIAIVTMTFVSIHSHEDPAAVGLGIHSAITLTQLFQWELRVQAEVDAMNVSLERIVEFSAIEAEADWDSKPGCEPPNGWPNAGEIIIQGLTVENSEHHTLLENISCDIQAREKVGIVGRTGCGKSLFLSTMLRIVEPSKGTIKIDNVDIMSIGVHDLRQKIAVVPADSELFLGTVRENYDPYGTHLDLAIWDVLKETYLFDTVKSLPLGLDTEIDEEDLHFTLAQKQLVCLGRAMLSDSHVLICDINPEADELIQEILMCNFMHCTIIASTYQLHNAIEFGKLMVLNQGKLDSFDDPCILFTSQSGAFYELIRTLGAETVQKLSGLARDFKKKKDEKTGRNSISAHRRSAHLFSTWRRINSLT